MEAVCGRAGTGLPLTGGIEGGGEGGVIGLFGEGDASTRDRIHTKQIHRGHSHESGNLSLLCAGRLCVVSETCNL